MKKTYVLDTNVLLTDVNSIFSYGEHDVVLPFTVLEELDNFKTRQDELGVNAREVSRRLSGLLHKSSGDFIKGIKLPNGGNIRTVSPANFIDNLPSDLNPEKKDNIILSVCKNIKNSILVTNDLILKIIANSCGIKSEGYKNELHTNALTYTGIQEINVSKEKLANLWTDTHKGKNLSPEINKLISHNFTNEFVHITNGEKNKPFVTRITENKTKFIPENYELPKIKPRNLEQRLALDLLLDSKINLVTIVGKSGTGKTLISLAAGLNQVVDKQKYKSLVILRPIIPVGKDLGFLPGLKEEKLEPWLSPIKDNLRFLLTSGNGRKSKSSEASLNYYFDRGIIEIEALTYIRGRSIANAFILIDEAQNLSVHELKTILTRVGEGTKIVLTGDVEQIDNMFVDTFSNGLAVTVERFKEYPIAGHITLRKGERSSLATLAANIL